MQIFSYFYDNMNKLKKISFRNGRTGYYYFYFEGAYLKKARVIKQDHLINLKYYFTVEDNMCTVSEIERRMTQEPEKKDLYETLKIGKGFFDKFKSLL